MAKKVVKKITETEPVSSGSAINVVEIKRVCACCRVSTNSADQGSSFEAQVDYYTRLVGEEEGWVLAGIYADEVRIGTRLYRRDNFQQTIRDYRQERINLVLTKSVTRFTRNTLDNIKAIRELRALGVGVYFEKEKVNILMERSGQMIAILSSIAQREFENISTNNKWSIVWGSRNGTFTISSPPYGCENNEYGELAIEKEGAEIMRWTFDEYLGGKGSYTIVAELETTGIPTIRGAKEWQDSVVKGILQDCAYEGDLLLQKTYTTDEIPPIREDNRGELPQYLIAGNREPIITREEASAIRQIYEYRREQQCVEDTSAYQDRYALSSRIPCEECGTKFRRQKIYIGRPYGKIQWCCYQHVRDGKECSQKTVREDIIQAAFLRLWNRLANNYEEIPIPMLAALKAIQSNPKQNREMQEIEQNIQELRRQGYRLGRVLTKGSIDSVIFIERRNQVEAQLEANWRRLRQLKGQRAFGWEISQTKYLMNVFYNRPVILEAYDEELFLLLMECIAILPGRRLIFRLKNGLELEENEQEVS